MSAIKQNDEPKAWCSLAFQDELTKTRHAALGLELAIAGYAREQASSCTLVKGPLQLAIDLHERLEKEAAEKAPRS